MLGRTKPLTAEESSFLLRHAATALVVWTLFVWVSRLRNVVDNDELTDFGRGWRIVVVGIFVSLAGLVCISKWKKSELFTPSVIALALWTIGFWLVRGGGILIGDYSAGFKAIHTVLMIVSIGLACLAGFALPRDASVRSQDHAGDGEFSPR